MTLWSVSLKALSEQTFTISEGSWFHGTIIRFVKKLYLVGDYHVRFILDGMDGPEQPGRRVIRPVQDSLSVYPKMIYKPF